MAPSPVLTAGEGNSLPASYFRAGPESPSQITCTLSPMTLQATSLSKGWWLICHTGFATTALPGAAKRIPWYVDTRHTSGVHLPGYRDAAVFWTFLLSPLFHQNERVLHLSSHNNFITWTKDSKSAVTNRIKRFVYCNIQTWKDAGPFSSDDPRLQQPRSSQSYHA